MPDPAGTATGDSVPDLIRAEAKRQGVHPALALAIAEQESGFNPTLTNPKKVGDAQENATGVFQLLPSTAKGLGVDPSNPSQNIAGGVKYLKQLLDKHKGDTGLVLKEYGGVVNDTEYVPAVTKRLDRYMELEAAGATADASQAARVDAQGASGAAGGAAAPVVTPPAPGVATPPPPGTAMEFPAGQQPNVVPGAAKIEPLEGSSLLKDIGMGIVRAHDPRTQEGRQNLFGLGGELAATALVPEVEGPMWMLRAQRIGKPLFGAMAASGLEQSAENALGTGNQVPAWEAAGWQGAYNIGGNLLLMPFKRGAKMLVSSSVAKGARTMLEENLTRAGERMRSDIAGVRRSTDQLTAQLRAKRDEAVEAARLLTQNTIETIRTEGADLLAKLPTVRAAGAAVRSGVAGQSRAQILSFATKLADSELAHDAALSDVRAVYDNVSKDFAEPGMLRTAQLAREVFEGPTKVALDQAGERVAAAASQGPPVAFGPIQATIERLRTSSPMQQVAEMLSGNAPLTPGAIANIASDQAVAAKAAIADPKFAHMKTSEVVAYIADQFAKLEGGETVDTLPVLMQRLGSAEVDELPYSTMHALKRVLDGSVRWDRAARATNEQLTKGLRIQVREAMRGFEPYDAANATYGSLASLYRKGMGAKMASAFKNDPDAAALLLNPGKPIAARMLKSLLVDQAAAGGDAQLGQQAWDAARSTFIHQKLMNGGIEGLESKLHKLTTTNKEFTEAVFGSDDVGQSVLHNLQSIVHGYNNVLKENAARTAELRLAGRLERAGMADEGSLAVAAATDTAAAAREAVKTATASKLARERAMGRGRIKQAERAGRDTIADAKEQGANAVQATTEAGKVKVGEAATALDTFKESSLGGKQSIAGMIGDLGHVFYTKGQTRGGFLALLRLMNGPNSNDLLTYMALSPKATNLFQQVAYGYTKGILSPAAERASAELFRVATSYLTSDPSTVPTAAQGAGPAAITPGAPAGRGPGPVGAPVAAQR